MSMIVTFVPTIVECVARSRRPEPSLARARSGASCASLDAIRGPSIESGCRGRYAVNYPMIKAPGIAPNHGMRRAYEDSRRQGEVSVISLEPNDPRR